MLRCMTICSHMICPFCSGTTKIYNSRSTHQKTQTWRRHVCDNCQHTYTTRERVDWTGVTTVKSPSDASGYSKDRLLLSLAKASDNLHIKPAMLTELCDSIEAELQKTGFFNEAHQESDLITHAATTILHRYKPNLALQYINNVYRNNPPLELIKQLITPQNGL